MFSYHPVAFFDHPTHWDRIMNMYDIGILEYPLSSPLLDWLVHVDGPHN